MKIREILTLCLLKIGYGTKIDMVNDENRTDEQNRIVEILLKCADMVYGEIATNHIPNIVTETVTLNDDKLNYSTLTSGKFVYAISLTVNEDSKKIKIYPTYLESNFSGKAQLEYVALPDNLTLNTEIPDSIPSWLIADGIVSEYAYAENMIDIGIQCERKFREGLTTLKARGCGKYVRARRWE